MGRKIEIKKIEDSTRCQVTFSKRRSSLSRKAEKICVRCDANIAVVAFSPSGRLTKYCNHGRVENIIEPYLNTPAHKRFSEIPNIQARLEKLKEFGHINDEEVILERLRKQVEDMEFRARRSTIEVQILEAHVREIELEREKSASLHQNTWSEKNLRDEKMLLSRSSAADSECTMLQKEQLITGNEGQSGLFDFIGDHEFYLRGECSSSTRQPANLIRHSDSYEYESIIQKFQTDSEGFFHTPPNAETAANNMSLTSSDPVQCQILENKCSISSTENYSQIHFPLENNVTYVLLQEHLSYYSANSERKEMNNVKDVLPEVYPQQNFGAYIMPEYRLWEHSPLPCQQNYASCSTYDNLVESYLVDVQPESSNFPSTNSVGTFISPEMAMTQHYAASSDITSMVQHLNLSESNGIAKTNEEDNTQIMSPQS